MTDHPTLPTPFVDAAWLRQHLDDVRIVDVRWYLDGRSGRAAYDRGHIPGAVWVDLDTQLSAPPGAAGRHPLPSPHVFAAAMASLGVDDDTPVVAYDDAGGVVASRLWWMLDTLGHPAAVLDGGLDAWGGELELEEVNPVSGSFAERPWPTSTIATADDVADLPDAAVLLDARSTERYEGHENPIDPRFGHIPGARSAPATAVLGADGRVVDASALRAHFGRLGIEPGTDVVAYCGSGVSACIDIAALRSIGVNATRLYVGSWSEWGADEARPIER